MNHDLSPTRLTFAAAAASLVFAYAPAFAEPGDTVYQQGFLSKEEALKSIEVPEGYELQLVLSEPEIREPVAMAWDGNGVLYVAEMRTYMQDIDATGEREPISQISRHEDADGDGVYEKHSVFIDNIVLPRMILPLDDRLMVGTTDTLDLWTYRDTDRDGKADEQVKVFEGGPRGGNMEHQPSGLIWALDNWLYLTYEAVRYRFDGETFLKEALPRGGGQWGLTQDDAGRLYYSTGGGENPAFYFQQPPQYGMIDYPNQTEPDFRRVYPIAEVPDVQGGKGRVGPNGGVNAFTGCAGQSIYRGDRLPHDLYGDLIIPEPVGRLIRRAKVARQDGKTYLSNAYPESEFIRTRDVNFRPVNTATGPDGCLYIADMHRGIIQQGNWVAPGSYLRPVVQKWGLDKNFGRGRIYRLVHRSFKPGPKPQMLKEGAINLLAHLSHPNGWWRDTAQKLIVLRKKEHDQIAPHLEQLARRGPSTHGRIHALWTLEGMGRVSESLLVDLLGDENALVRAQAVRVSEPFLAKPEGAVAAKVARLGNERDAEVAIQAVNSIAFAAAESPALHAAADKLVARFGDTDAFRAIAAQRAALAEQRKRQAEQRRRDAAFGKAMEQGEMIYNQLCFTCHGPDGKGMPFPGGEPGQMMAPNLAGSPRVLGSGGTLVRVILHGMLGPLEGKNYPNVMAPMGTNDDDWVSAAATYVRNSFGNKGGAIEPGYVAKIRAAHADRTTPWTEPELEALEPPKLANQADWKFAASHRAEGCRAAVDGNAGSRWDTGASQEPGMWFQVELPEPCNLNRIVLDTRNSNRDYPRGYEVRLSADGQSWSDPVAAGTGIDPVTDIGFPNQTAKFLRITQTGSVNGLFWSIHEMEIYGKAAR
ncbi:MAG: discoidin domain-containing protein [Verrucomicrobiales bacterium]